MIALLTEMAAQHRRELQAISTGRRSRRGSRARARAGHASAPSPPGPASAGEISIRRLGEADNEALERLAGRDSAPVPRGQILGAERHERLIAAVSLSTGELIADPFTPTATTRALLELRVAQLRGPAPEFEPDRQTEGRARSLA